MKKIARASNSATRGKGLLEGFLANQRARIANRLIPPELRSGRILDVGCGSQPYFLAHTKFRQKFAVDQLEDKQGSPEIIWAQVDLNKDRRIPFHDNYFNAVTMLAVVEHLNPDKLDYLFRDIYRILKPGGIFILTTPAAWSDGLLHWMSAVHLVSKEEIDEHVFAYTLPLLGWYFGAAGFSLSKVKFGYFELLLNQWATAVK
jgi:SAM-dependent methyltransferase